MASTPYRWRKLSEEDRQSVLEDRLRRRRPTHSPHHIDSGTTHFHLSAACFEHLSIIGKTNERLTSFSHQWLDLLNSHFREINAWVILPNHYHALVHTSTILELLKALGRLHGSTSHQWNGEDNTRGRQVWCKAVETVMKSTGHYHATVNYIHHNLVRHGYVTKWTDWPWSSAHDFLENHGRLEAERLWKTYPLQDFGQGWDDPEL